MDARVRQFSNAYCKDSVPALRPGYRVEVHQRITEGKKERIQIFKGMVIGVKNSNDGINATFTVRNIASGVGVEKVFPLHSPSIVQIDVKRAHKVRRAKLNYVRDLSGKSLRMQEVPFTLEHITVEKAAITEPAAPVAEAEDTAAEIVEDAAADTDAEAPVTEAA
ncbi:50S ribosomal protein L19 [Candidatus Peribacteria bacterium]|nr:50S ribosomal protein L19 [Candidatus Peribacteria bacterium]